MRMPMNSRFDNDLKRFYALLGERQRELGGYFSIVESQTYDRDVEAFIDAFLHSVELACIKENRVAALGRLINLRDEQLVQALEKEGKDTVFITLAKEKAYLWVKAFYLKRHEALLALVEQEALLSAFYRRILRGVHDVGIVLSAWQSAWNEHIINTINPLLELEYQGDAQAIAQMLQAKGLLDKDTFGNDGDRSYSVLQKVPGGYEAQAYALAFPKEVLAVQHCLTHLIADLKGLDDADFHQEEAYIAYFQALCDAFGEKDRAQLIAQWADVDRKWMAITAPIQIGHPLEYYEDHYKKAVALEWDVRVSNPWHHSENGTYERVKHAFTTLFNASGSEALHVKHNVLSNLKRVQLYIGRPALFYAAAFNGLFSAQVVPNDEVVSAELGKKIFAFADNILDGIRAKPFLKIHHDVFGKAFMDTERALIFHDAPTWHKVYDVSTVGHEYGHILWMDGDTETKMNRSGVFKNIEEFKATAGGLVSFFLQEDAALAQHLLADTIKRAVGLIGWMKTAEVEPYYCEGLIHLEGLFASGVLSFDDRLHIDMSPKAYETLKAWYIATYEALAKHYLDKKDAKEFLERYAHKEEGVYAPNSLHVKAFVDYYWSMHQHMGRDIDESVKREEWMLDVSK